MCFYWCFFLEIWLGEEDGLVIVFSGWEVGVGNFMIFYEELFKVYVFWEDVIMVVFGVFGL